MKPTPPTMRDKKRYVAFMVFCDSEITKKEVINAIINSAHNFFGELTMSKFNLWVNDFDEDEKRGFLVCNQKYKSEVITSLTLINNVNGIKTHLNILGVSGTIKALKRKFLNDY